MNSIDPHLRTPYFQQWGVNLQWEARDTMVEVGYVGTKGSLPVRRAINQALLAQSHEPDEWPNHQHRRQRGTARSLCRLLAGRLAGRGDCADSRYNSLQASVTHRFRHGLRFLVSYTWSKSMDDTSGGSTTIFSEVNGDEDHLWVSKGALGLRPYAPLGGECRL